ncbi:MAG TPA: hypothetical protein VJR30_25535 [Bradyrhizobium sp.]|nr:hypothetical protein [Bradyrhizobium sp.]
MGTSGLGAAGRGAVFLAFGAEADLRTFAFLADFLPAFFVAFFAGRFFAAFFVFLATTNSFVVRDGRVVRTIRLN